MLCDDHVGWDGVGGRDVQEGEDICMHMADSCCSAETTTFPSVLLPPWTVSSIILILL